MRDITFDVDDYRLNCRAGGVIIHDGKVLLHKNPNEPYYAIIGGRISLGEDSETTIKRELLEETGKEVEVKSFLSLIENFFDANERKYHEYLFLYNLEFKNEDDKKLLSTLQPAEEHKKGKLEFHWVDINDFDKLDIRPEAAKRAIIEKLPHYINCK